MKTLTDFDKYLSEITLEATLGESGWDTAVHSVATATGPITYLYLYDEPTKWCWLAGVARQDWLRVTGEGARLRFDEMDAVRGSLAVQISKFADSKPGTARTLDDEKRIIGWAMLYAGSTQTLAMSGAENLGHFMVILYRKPGANQGNLRPFAGGLTDGEPMESGQFLALTHEVMARDRRAHPSWIAGDDPR